MPAARPRLLVLALAALAALRVVVFAVLDRRPLYGGWEAPDLQRAMHYHYGLRDHLEWGFWEQMARDGFKPPLWYGGMPLLFSWRESLSTLDFLLPNAVCAALLVGLCFVLARRLGGLPAGLLAAAFATFLPGIAWRLPMVGVEPAHAVLLTLAVLALLELRAGERRWGPGLVLGLCAGLGALMKWNFAAYLVPPALALLAMRRSTWAPLVLAGGVAAALFLPWAVGVADLSAIFSQGAEGEVGKLGWLLYPRDLALYSLGVLGWGALAAAWYARSRLPAPEGSAPPKGPIRLVAVTGATVLLLHLLIPHKESRYLLPAFPLFAVLLALPVVRVPRRALAALLVLGGLQSWVLPWLLKPAETFEWWEVLPAPVRDDYDIAAVLAHPSLRARERTVVTSSLGPDAYFPLLTFLQWELYARNPNPVLTRSDWPDLLTHAAAFDLQRSTHFLSNRELSPDEQLALRSMGFERVVTVSPRMEDIGALSLWALEAGAEPPFR